MFKADGALEGIEARFLSSAAIASLCSQTTVSTRELDLTELACGSYAMPNTEKLWQLGRIERKPEAANGIAQGCRLHRSYSHWIRREAFPVDRHGYGSSECHFPSFQHRETSLTDSQAQDSSIGRKTGFEDHAGTPIKFLFYWKYLEESLREGELTPPCIETVPPLSQCLLPSIAPPPACPATSPSTPTPTTPSIYKNPSKADRTSAGTSSPTPTTPSSSTTPSSTSAKPKTASPTVQPPTPTSPTSCTPTSASTTTSTPSIRRSPPATTT